MNNELFRLAAAERRVQIKEHESAVEKHMESLREKYPRLAALDAEIKRSFLEALRQTMTGRVPDPSENLRLQAERSEFLRGIGENAGNGPMCTLCGDKLRIDNAPCRCLEPIAARIARERVGMDLNGVSFDRLRLSLYSDDGDGVTPRANMEYLLGLSRYFTDNFGTKRQNLLFSGAPGTGKTYLAGAIAAELCDRGFLCAYISASQAMRLLEAVKFDRDDADHTAVRRLYESDLLILDDLGTEFLNNFSQAALYELINTRVCKPTLIITGLNATALSDRYSPQLVSRLLGDYTMCVFLGDDVRPKLSRATTHPATSRPTQ